MDVIVRSAVERSILLLRDDALAHGEHELAQVYSWSLIRFNGERVVESIKLLSKPNG